MNFDIFAPDFGTLPSPYFKKSAITNPIELLWNDDLCLLLRLCGANEELIGERASDYDRFYALCCALPLMEGHPMRAWIATVLEKHFNFTDLPTEKTAPTVWRELCELLMQRPIAPQELVCGAWLCDTITVPEKLPKQVNPVLCANLLLQTSAKNAAAWSSEIASVVEHFAANRCQKIVLQVGKDFDFVTPSLYHIDHALSLIKKDGDAIHLLTSQLVRELCAVAQKHNLLLVLVCDGNSAAVANLLQYCEESVGLPRITWSVKEAREASALLDFAAKPHKNEILAALPYNSVMTADELSATLSSWKVRYPIGKLNFITARDLRQTPHAQAHISNMLKMSKTKI